MLYQKLKACQEACLKIAAIYADRGEADLCRFYRSAAEGYGSKAASLKISEA